MIYQRSSALFAAAQEVIPGGVNSPVRAFKAVGGDPIFVKKAQGAYLYDEDDRRLIDYINSWGPMLLGHAFEPVVKAVIEKAKKGTSFGMPTQLETEIAELAVSMVPNIDKIRFVNSGTEACMSAIRLARGYTDREKIIKFAGCYHGHSDAFLIQAGSGAVTFGSPNSPGVTKGTAKDTLLASYNDLDNVKQLFEANPGAIAAIIIEPVAGNMGCIPPAAGFLEGLRALCDTHGALLIFDEVMTGFRLAWGGATEIYDLNPDIICYGKIIGGGMPVGAFGGKKEIFECLSPLGGVYQAGTLSGNPVAMTAGFKTLELLRNDLSIYDQLETKTRLLAEALQSIFDKKGKGYSVNQIGSMISCFFSDESIHDYASAKTTDTELFGKYFRHMLSKGIYLPPSNFESWFISDSLTEKHVEKIVLETKLFF